MTGSGERSWCIVGGGMLGLTLALRLANARQDVTVIEAAPRLGGLADAWTLGGVTWDRHYHVMLLSDLHLRGLLEELDLGTAVTWSATRTDFHADGQFHPLNNAVDFLRFPLLGLVDKTRLAATILYGSRIEDGLSLEKIPVEDWLVRLSGRRTFERLWKPLLRAKLGENYTKASASFIWAIIRRMYAARRGGLKTEMFGYVRGGYERIVSNFERTLAAKGVRLVAGTPVSRIGPAGDGRVEVRLARTAMTFDRVVVTLASPLASRICEGLDVAEKRSLENVLYQGLVCASVLLRRPLRGSYLTYIADPQIPFTAVIEMSALVDPAQFGGKSLVYLPCYIPATAPLFDVSDNTIKTRFLDALRAMYPSLAADDILAFEISRVRNVLPVATLDYTERMPAVRTSVPGLFVLNSTHIVNGTLNVNETIKLAGETAPHLLAGSWGRRPGAESQLAGAA